MVICLIAVPFALKTSKTATKYESYPVSMAITSLALILGLLLIGERRQSGVVVKQKL